MADALVYRKDGSEYVFTLRDAEGNIITAKVGVAPTSKAGEPKIGNDTLALFPQRSDSHKRIKAFLEAEAAKAIVPSK